MCVYRSRGLGACPATLAFPLGLGPLALCVMFASETELPALQSFGFVCLVAVLLVCACWRELGELEAASRKTMTIEAFGFRSRDLDHPSRRHLRVRRASALPLLLLARGPPRPPPRRSAPPPRPLMRVGDVDCLWSFRCRRTVLRWIANRPHEALESTRGARRLISSPCETRGSRSPGA